MSFEERNTLVGTVLVLNMNRAACALGDTAGTLTKLALYRRGLAG